MFDHRRMTRLASGILASLLLSLSLVSVATAQDQTPRELPFTPDPGFCTIEPRSIDELATMFGTPPAATPMPPTPDIGTPAGDEADKEIVGQVTTTVIEAIACANATDYFRFLALFSDEALPVFVGDAELDRDTLRQLEMLAGTPQAESDWTTLTDVRDVRNDDGRISAIVETATAGQAAQADLFYFVQQDDRYLIDGIIEGVVSPESTPAA